MNLDIKLHINDLPEELVLGDNIAIDCEFNGLNIKRDRLCLVQISTGKNDAHIIKFEKKEYNAPNFKKVITNDTDDSKIKIRGTSSVWLQLENSQSIKNRKQFLLKVPYPNFKLKACF